MARLKGAGAEERDKDASVPQQLRDDDRRPIVNTQTEASTNHRPKSLEGTGILGAVADRYINPIDAVVIVYDRDLATKTAAERCVAGEASI